MGNSVIFKFQIVSIILEYLHIFFFFHFLSVLLWDKPQPKVHFLAGSLFFLTITRSCRQVRIRGSVYISKSRGILCVSFSWMDSELYIYHLFVWSNLNFLHNFQWIILPDKSYLALYYLCANLLHSLIMWLKFSSQSPNNLHLIFCCNIAILTFLYFVIIALFCAVIRRKLVSL